MDICVLRTFALHLADDDSMPNLLIVVIAYKHTDCISFLHISVDLILRFYISMDNVSCICELECSCVRLEPGLIFVQSVDCEQNMFFFYNC